MWNSAVLITIAYYFALFFIPFVVYIVLFEETKSKSTRYKSPDWYYLIKRIFSLQKIKKLKEKCKKQQLSLSEELQEQPRKLISGKQTDTQTVYGLDQNGNSIFFKIILRQHRIAEVTLCLRLNNGKVYKLPNEPQVLLCSIASRQWKAEGLSMTVVEPFHKIRITYNGLLQDISQVDITAKTCKTEHVKFNFIWNAAEKPLYYPQDMPTALFSDGLARMPWRDGDWIDLMGDERGYEQYGFLQGFVAGEAYPEDLILHLPSFRKRYWGTAENFALHREFTVFVCAEDGTLFNIGARSYKKGCSQLNYGTILDNTLDVYPIDQHDINLEYIAENDIPNSITLHVKAKGKTFKCIITINHQNTSTTSSNALKGWELKTTTTECILNSQKGYAFASFWYPKHGTGVDLPDPLLAEPKIDFPQYNFAAPFFSKECRVTSLAGGKGSSLALLSYLNTNNFIVPEGFVVLVPAFKHQLEQNEKLNQAVVELENVSRGKIEKDLVTACKETVDLLSSEPVAEKIKIEVLEQLDNIRKKSDGTDDTWQWAVRSSGISEDSDELSSAGQNATILGCTTEDDILQAVSKCWGSLFAYQSVQYRRQHGLDINCSMAVVIQRMVPSETAGVLFSCHPTSGDPSKIVITSNYGLGESVVSGQADPDTIVLNRSWSGGVNLHSKQIGSKKVLVQLNTSGTQVTDTSSDKAQSLSLTEEQALLLGRVAVELEKAFGSPRDIEWAFVKDKLYMLQSRPITSFNTWTDFELLHEFDTPILTDQELTTIANIAEVMPGALTPLSNHIVNRILSNSVYKYITGKAEDPFIPKFTGSVCHHGTISIINACFRQLDNKITIADRVLEMAIFGHTVMDEKMHAVARARFGVLSKFGKILLLLKEITGALTIEKCINNAIVLGSKFKARINKSASALEKLNAVNELLLDISKITYCHGRASHVSVFYQIIAMNILAEGSDDLTNDHYSDISLLLSSCSNVVSAEIPKMLENISQAIREAGLSEVFIKVNPKEGISWLKLNCLKASKQFETFLEEHGHRGLREFELQATAWASDPSVVIKMLQANCRGTHVSKSSECLNPEETVAKMVTPKNDTVRRILKFLLKRSRKSVGQREKTKSETVRMVNEIRIAFHDLAKQMVLEGMMPDSQLIYYFSFYELQQLVKKRNTSLVQKAIRRQRLYPQWDKLKLPEVMFGFPKLEENQASKLLRSGDSKVKLKGTPVYPGDIVARACVITDLKDIDQLQSGDILITHSTDVGWSPYFPMLAAVVTELGGLISHGAVIAREYGLPCIVGVQNATSVFKTGDEVILSGKLGILELASSNDSAS